ncbi:MAG: hypothetical protein ACPGQG_02435 [Candidatus Thalassarchaeaceae archaeon]
MSEADAKPMMPIILSGAIGAITLLDAFVLTGDTGDLVKVGAGFGSIAVSASLLFSGGLSMPPMPSRRKEEPEPEPEQKF